MDNDTRSTGLKVGDRIEGENFCWVITKLAPRPGHVIEPPKEPVKYDMDYSFSPDDR